METNKHHLAYDRRIWQRQRFHRLIRQHQGLIIPLPTSIHVPLHNKFQTGVPLPTSDAAHAFNQIVLPYEVGQPWHRTLDQAIGFFSMTGNFGTADHLAEQREFISERLQQVAA